MTLRDIRERLIKATGRTDLIEDQKTYPDDGADWYINAGIRFLDQQLPGELSRTKVIKATTEGSPSISIPDVRAIKDVRIQESGERNRDLERYGLFDFYEHFGDEEYLSAEGNQGKPMHYAYGIQRGLNKSSLNQAPREARVLLLHPVPDKVYDIAITSENFSQKLEDDSDINWWTLNFPELLVLAARREIEVDHRNQTGVQQFEQQLNRRLMDIDSDQVSDEISNSGQMDNAW